MAYGELADLYDAIHAGKPYPAEARAVRALARRYARRPLRTLLDVACGSGRHLEQLQRWFDCAGVDASPRMLARARRRVPRAELHRGRMPKFDLGREFDVVTCLFSAIGYVRSPEALRTTLRTMARHTSPGGVVVVEPWLTPEAFRVGRVRHQVAETPGATIVRVNEVRRRGNRTIFDFHYLVGRRGKVRYFVETHDLGLFSRRTMLAAFRQAGLEPVYLPGGLTTRRGLYVGRKPEVPGPRERRSLRRGRSQRPSRR